MATFIVGMISLVMLHLMVLWGVFSLFWVSLNPWIIIWNIAIIVVFSGGWFIFSDLNWPVKEADKVLAVIFCHRNWEINKGWCLANQITKLDSLWVLNTVCETEKVSESIFASWYLLCLFLMGIYHLPVFGRIKEYLVWLFRWRRVTSGISYFAYSFVVRRNVGIYLLLSCGAHFRLFIYLLLLIFPQCGHVAFKKSGSLTRGQIWFRKMLLTVFVASTYCMPDSHGRAQRLWDLTAR